MKTLITLLILFFLSPLAHADHVKGHILVTLDNPGNRTAAGVVAAVKQGVKSIPGTWRRIGGGRTIFVDVTPGFERHAVERFKKRREVTFAELDELCAPDIIPNDAFYPNQWHLPNIGAPAAWEVTFGSGSVKIAICDTGCDPTHPDLMPNYIPGWNFYDNTSSSADVHGHGTHVAGVAGAAGNNTIGVSGVAWTISVMPLRVTDPTGYASFGTISTALHYAADNGCKVANVSFSNAATSGTILSAGQYLYERGGLLCIAAGNTGGLLSGSENRYVLVVGSTGSGNMRSSFSSYGQFVTISSPGENIWATKRGGGYGGGSGTSLASPVVAGVAGLLWSLNPALTSQQVRAILLSTALDLGTAGKDDYYGYGKVDAAKAIHAATDPPPATDDIAPFAEFVTPKPGQRINKRRDLKVEVSASDNVGVVSVSLSMDGLSKGTATTAPYVWTIPKEAISLGSHTLTAVVSDKAGNSRTVRVMFKK